MTVRIKQSITDPERASENEPLPITPQSKPMPHPLLTKKCVIALDVHKIPTFEKHLAKDDYIITGRYDVSPGVVALVVHTQNMQALAQTVLRANQEIAKW